MVMGPSIQHVLPTRRCMAVARGRPGHSTALRCSLLLLLLLAFSSCASARDKLHAASSRGKGGAKSAQKATATAASSGNNRQHAARAGNQQQQQQQQQQRAGPSLLDRDETAAGSSKKEDLQLRQRAGLGGEKSLREKGLQQQEGVLQAEEDFPGQGSRGAAREPGKQPKALHAEQFPGNGAQVRTWSSDSHSFCAAKDCSLGPA